MNAYHLLPTFVHQSARQLTEQGMLSEQLFVERYLASSAVVRTLHAPHWRFYVAFSLFKLAGILQGVYKRAVQGNSSDPRAARATDRYPDLRIDRIDSCTATFLGGLVKRRRAHGEHFDVVRRLDRRNGVAGVHGARKSRVILHACNESTVGHSRQRNVRQSRRPRRPARRRGALRRAAKRFWRPTTQSQARA